DRAGMEGDASWRSHHRPAPYSFLAALMATRPERGKLRYRFVVQGEGGAIWRDYQQKTEGRPGMTAHPTGGEMRVADRHTLRPGWARRYAIVPDVATQAQYIWDPDTDEWYGPFGTRWDAEFTLLRARERPDRCPH
ncbi:MAG TPA: hypothetical protein VJY65_02675, partial [Chloroflexota bacterium]|nr:hypothetical protein [Chloroflexota bacterium]